MCSVMLPSLLFSRTNRNGRVYAHDRMAISLVLLHFCRYYWSQGAGGEQNEWPVPTVALLRNHFGQSYKIISLFFRPPEISLFSLAHSPLFWYSPSLLVTCHSAEAMWIILFAFRPFSLDSSPSISRIFVFCLSKFKCRRQYHGHHPMQLKHRATHNSQQKKRSRSIHTHTQYNTTWRIENKTKP